MRHVDDIQALGILILGGDGFCGWPTSLYLSAQGHDVTIADNLSRRRIDEELDATSLTPIQPLDARAAAWHEVTGQPAAARRPGPDLQPGHGSRSRHRPRAAGSHG